MTGKTGPTRAERLRQRRQKQQPADEARPQPGRAAVQLPPEPKPRRLGAVQPEPTDPVEPAVRIRRRSERRSRRDGGQAAGPSPMSLLLPGRPQPQSRPGGKPRQRPSTGSGQRPSTGSGQRYATMTGTPTLRRGQFTRQGGGRGGDRSFDPSSALRAGIAFSLGRSGEGEYKLRAPTISLPRYGPRLISGLGTVLLAFVLYTMWTSPVFIVAAAEVRGNQRLSSQEVNAMLGMAGEPIFKAAPALLALDLRTAFPDISAARVHVGFPNRLVVDVSERLPLLAWYQDGAVTWIDADGVAFLPRGQVEGMLQVNSNGAPHQVQTDPDAPLYERAFIEPAMVQAMLALHPYVPAGLPMIYDPRYGMGWQDPRGWFVYFGQSPSSIPMKLVIYQSIVDTFLRQGIQPTLVSVEHLDAPFYK